MASDNFVIGHFADIASTRAAIQALRADGYDDELEAFYPFPEHGIEEDLFKGKKRSPVRRFTMLGGLVGCLGAFTFTSWMSVDYPLRVSAKPLVSIPAFVVVAFECTILLGAIFTLLSMFHFSKIPNFFRSPGYRRQFSSGTFGLVIRTPKDNSDVVKQRMESLGAEEVEVEYAG